MKTHQEKDAPQVNKSLPITEPEPAPMTMDDIAMRFLTTPPKPKPAPKKKASKRTK